MHGQFAYMVRRRRDLITISEKPRDLFAKTPFLCSVLRAAENVVAPSRRAAAVDLPELILDHHRLRLVVLFLLDQYRLLERGEPSGSTPSSPPSAASFHGRARLVAASCAVSGRRKARRRRISGDRLVAAVSDPRRGRRQAPVHGEPGGAGHGGPHAPASGLVQRGDVRGGGGQGRPPLPPVRRRAGVHVPHPQRGGRLHGRARAHEAGQGPHGELVSESAELIYCRSITASFLFLACPFFLTLVCDSTPHKVRHNCLSLPN